MYIINIHTGLLNFCHTGNIEYGDIISENCVTYPEAQAEAQEQCDELDHSSFDSANTDIEYTMIAKNFYGAGLKKAIWINDTETCSCENRAMLTECPHECVENCTNQRIKNGLPMPVTIERFTTIDKGYGVKVSSDIKKDTMIVEYVIEVTTEHEYKMRLINEYRSDAYSYAMHLENKFIVDAHRKRNLARFVNHSCAPNCHIEKWTVDGLPRLILVASRDIYSNEELSYDYNFFLYIMKVHKGVIVAARLVEKKLHK